MSLNFYTIKPLTFDYGSNIIRLMRVTMTFYDEETGQVIETVDRAVFFGHKAFLDKDYVKVFVAFLRDILEDKDVLKGPVKLFLYAVDKANFNDLRVTIFPQEAIKDLGITKGTFYNWLKVLLDKGYMEKLATNVYRLKPYTAIKGQMKKVPDLGFFERQ
jgi:hypothetical protein